MVTRYVVFRLDQICLGNLAPSKADTFDRKKFLAGGRDSGITVCVCWHNQAPAHAHTAIQGQITNHQCKILQLPAIVGPKASQQTQMTQGYFQKCVPVRVY